MVVLSRIQANRASILNRTGQYEEASALAGSAVHLAQTHGAIAVYPGLDGVQVLSAAADRLETESIDHIPIVDRVPDVTNALFATGWSGHGWAIAPAVTELLADWAQSGYRPVQLRSFAYKRFFM